MISQFPVLAGTDFQQAIWQQLVSIPFVETVTYLRLSERVGVIKAVCVVASADGASTSLVVVPCHRVIGSANRFRRWA
jgi:methylated-DNA-[protein]-cysteine S-methyltransferase